MSLQARITSLAQTLGADIKALEDIVVPGGFPGGPAGAVQFNADGVFGGATDAGIHDDSLVLGAPTVPTVPPAGFVKLFGKQVGTQRVLPCALAEDGSSYPLQPSFVQKKIFLWSPGGNATTVPGIFGGPAMTVAGTATVRSVATTNMLTRMKRLAYVSAAGAGSMCSVRGQAQYTSGNGGAIPLGGFFASFRFAFTDATVVTTSRAFVGMNSAAPTNVEMDTRTNHFGIAKSSTNNTQLYLVYGGSAAQTATPLGVDFPPMAAAGATNGVPYDLQIWCPPTQNGVFCWRLDRLDTGLSTGGTVTPATPGVQTPLSTTLLAPSLWRCNNTTAAACGLDVSQVYIETDY